MSNNYGLNNDYQLYEIALDSLDNCGPFIGGNAGTDWPMFRLSIPMSNVAAVKVLEVQVPVTYYVINRHNNTFILQESNDEEATVTIPVGNYNAADLVQATEQAIQAASASIGVNHVYTSTYYPTTAKAAYTSVGGHAFTLKFGAPTNSGNVNPRLWLGFNGGNITSVNGTITTPNVILATGANYLYLNSHSLGTDIKMILSDAAVNISSTGNGPQLAKIPVNVNPNEVIFWSGNII